MVNGYVNDIFLSYSRAGCVRDWMSNHFLPRLRSHMTDLLPVPPRLFFDEEQQNDTIWRANFRHHILRSKYLVAVWSRPYFESYWCMAEWRSIEQRTAMLDMGTAANPHTLMYPIVFADGETFPGWAKERGKDLRKWAYDLPQFSETRDYLPFDDEMRRVAQDLVGLLPHAPAWDPDWPILEPDPEPRVTPSLPRLT